MAFETILRMPESKLSKETSLKWQMEEGRQTFLFPTSRLLGMTGITKATCPILGQSRRKKQIYVFVDVAFDIPYVQNSVAHLSLWAFKPLNPTVSID